MGKPRILNEIILKIRGLREKGYSIPEMHRLLKISKATISRYSKGVEILPEFKQRWLDRRNASKIISERAWEIAEKSALELLPRVDRATLVAVMSSLYWAEGSKNDFSLSNTDPGLIKVFLYCLRNIFYVKDEDLKISIRMYEDLDRNSCIKFWSNIVGFDLENRVSINILKGKKVGKLQYGMCRIRVRKAGLIFKTIFAINKRVTKLIFSS